jgi:hypothetical protein
MRGKLGGVSRYGIDAKFRFQLARQLLKGDIHFGAGPWDSP